MLNIDINRIRKEDAVQAHALVLTLKHFNFNENLFNINFIDDEYYVFMGEEVFDFDSFDNIPMFIISNVAKEPDELIDLKTYYSNVIKLGFNNLEALEYLNFYSEREKKLTKAKAGN